MPHRRRALWILLLLLLPAACQAPRSGAEVPRMAVEELKALLDAGEPVVIVDTRVSRQYQVRHIPGAISIPERETEGRLGELPQDALIVLY